MKKRSIYLRDLESLKEQKEIRLLFGWSEKKNPSLKSIKEDLRFHRDRLIDDLSVNHQGYRERCVHSLNYILNQQSRKAV